MNAAGLKSLDMGAKSPSEDCKQRDHGNPSKAKIETIISLENKLRLEQVDEKTKINDASQNPLSNCFGAPFLLNNAMSVLRSLTCLEIGYCTRSASRMDDDALSDCSIPSKVYLTDSSHQHSSSDKSIGRDIVLKTKTFYSVDSTLLSSQQSSKAETNTEECILLADDGCAITSTRKYFEDDNLNNDETELVLQRSVSPLSFPSFGGQSFSSKEYYSLEDNIVQGLGLGSAASIIPPTIESKDSLLSFDVSCVSGGSDALLDILSMDSDEGEDLGKTLNDICEQSVQSSSLSVLSPEYDQVPDTAGTCIHML